MIHKKEHEYARKTVKLKNGTKFIVEDWWDRISGKSWMLCEGNPGCLHYAISSVGKPIDNEVVYGKIGNMGSLQHVSDIVGLV